MLIGALSSDSIPSSPGALMQKFKIEINQVIGFLIAILIFGLLSIVYTQTKLLDGIEWSSTDFRFFLRDPSQKARTLKGNVKVTTLNPRAHRDIIVLGIDEETIREFDNQEIEWPFPWNIHAKFTRYVGTGEPNAIFYDIMFLKRKKKLEDDFAASFKEAGSVFLDFPFETETVQTKYTDIAERLKYFERIRFKADPKDDTKPLVTEAVPPNPVLIKNAKGIGFANIFPDERDNINRTIPLYLKYNGYYYPNIDLMLVMNYFGITEKDFEIKWGEYIKLKNLPAAKMKKPNSERSIVIPIDKRGFMDVNFIGGPGSFIHQPYHYFYRDGSMKGNASLKGKIVLVAAYSVTGIATDEKQSPYGAMFGIEHHANALNTILTQDFLYRLSEIQNVIILLVIAVLLGIIIPRVSIIVSIIFTGVMALAYMVGSFMIFDSKSYIVIMATPVLQIGLTFTIIITYRVLTEQKEKKYIRQTFSKFVSKSVVDELLKHPDKLKLGGDKQVLSVLFSDIRGFTTLSEKLTPEALVEHLNVYLQAMTDIVIKYNGTLDKYVGDEIMAFWGAPIPQADHALLACRAALDMMIQLHEMNKVWEAQNKPPLDIGIGINTGDMVVGNMGSSSRMDYTLMGDMVNLGARLEGTNKVYSTHIIISEFTYEHVKDDIIARELDLIRVKGKALPVKIFELLDVKEHVSATPVTTTAPAS